MKARNCSIVENSSWLPKYSKRIFAFFEHPKFSYKKIVMLNDALLLTLFLTILKQCTIGTYLVTNSPWYVPVPCDGGCKGFHSLSFPSTSFYHLLSLPYHAPSIFFHSWCYYLWLRSSFHPNLSLDSTVLPHSRPGPNSVQKQFFQFLKFFEQSLKNYWILLKY